MSLLRSLEGGLRALFRKEEAEQELQDELHSYLENSAGEKMRRGMSAEEARRAARLELGSTEAIKEEVRGAGWENMLETYAQDLRYALRALGNSPGVHDCGGAYFGPGHWRQCVSVQRCEHGLAAAPAVQESVATDDVV